MENRILFRGSISIGKFRLVDDATNTVMGEAVSDAAAWYDKADWIGIAATPHASMFIDALIEREGKTIDSLLVDYDVPLKARPPIDGLQRVAGLPVQVAAERLGVSRSTVKRWRRQVGGLLTKVAR